MFEGTVEYIHDIDIIYEIRVYILFVIIRYLCFIFYTLSYDFNLVFNLICMNYELFDIMDVCMYAFE